MTKIMKLLAFVLMVVATAMVLGCSKSPSAERPVDVIDCDVTLSVPDGWAIVPDERQIQSRVRGKLEWDPTKISLFLADGQQNGRLIKGDELRKELEGKQVLTANVLDYVLANPELIPESWKENDTFFWGTIYRDSDGSLCVRYLFWRVGHWGWGYGWLSRQFDYGNPAAVSASQ